MSWGDNLEQMQHENMINMLETALDKPEPQRLVVTQEMRREVMAEIRQHIVSHVPMQYSWIIDMALLDYGCRALIALPDEAE
jgi:hypothetical protein